MQNDLTLETGQRRPRIWRLSEDSEQATADAVAVAGHSGGARRLDSEQRRGSPMPAVLEPAASASRAVPSDDGCFAHGRQPVARRGVVDADRAARLQSDHHRVDRGPPPNGSWTR